MTKARKRGRPVRIYFKCTKGGNEKALWLDAFSVINRLSESGRRTFGLRSALANNVRFVRPYGGRVRKRISCVDDSACSLRDVGPGGEGYIGPHKLTRDESQRLLSYQGDDVTARINQMYYGIPMKKNEEKEYKVKPGYAYPHRWMTIQELHTEMMLQSTNFHDLTDPDRSSEKIGSLRVEVLQCIGLPRLDLASDTDAVIYMVCGPHAFTTDVIPDRTNPMWLRKTKRACIFPIYHGYARLFVGVFDDDGENAKDDYAGRVVVDVARLRHQSTYDVLLPLRLSAHVYSRRPRGAVRLRFTLEWKNEKDVLLSYIPKNFKITPPLQSKPDTSTTIPCADPKAFRNVAFTVHGEDLPGRFKLGKIKASIREGKQDIPPEESHNCAKMAHSNKTCQIACIFSISKARFTMQHVLAIIRQEFSETKRWVNPTMSAFVFCAWMHCIYKASVGLVPVYIGLYVLLQLIRTYAIYAVERPTREGFLAPTWEELFEALILPKSATSIEALDVHRDHSSPGSGVAFSGRPDPVQMKTHTPLGRFLFKCLGFYHGTTLWVDQNSVCIWSFPLLTAIRIKG